MDLTALTQASFVIQLHVVAALVAALLGPLALLRRRRDRLHKTAGYFWVSAMAITALSSFFIHELRMIGLFSPIHILSIVTIIGLWHAIQRIRVGDVKWHKRIMWRLYSQAIGLAGLFAFLPGRHMNDLFVQVDPWLVFGMAVLVFVLVGFWISISMRRVLRAV